MKRSLNIRKSLKFNIFRAILYQMLSKWVYSHHCCIQCEKLLSFHFLILAIHGYQREVLSIEPGIDLPLHPALFPVGDGDNPRTNKTPLKNMVYYVVKHFPKYV